MDALSEYRNALEAQKTAATELEQAENAAEMAANQGLDQASQDRVDDLLASRRTSIEMNSGRLSQAQEALIARAKTVLIPRLQSVSAEALQQLEQGEIGMSDFAGLEQDAGNYELVKMTERDEQLADTPDYDEAIEIFTELSTTIAEEDTEFAIEFSRAIAGSKIAAVMS
jgi:hypothetical protein